MEILVPRDEPREGLGGEKRLVRVKGTTVVDVGEAPAQHRALDRQLVFGAYEIRRRLSDLLSDGAQLRVEGAHGTRRRLRLAVEVRHFLVQVVQRSPQL